MHGVVLEQSTSTAGGSLDAGTATRRAALHGIRRFALVSLAHAGTVPPSERDGRMATNQVRDAESLLTGPVYAIGDTPNAYGKVKVTVMGGEGMQDLNLTPDQISTLGIERGQFVAFWVRFGVFNPAITPERPERQQGFLFAAFVRPATVDELNQIVASLTASKAAGSKAA